MIYRLSGKIIEKQPAFIVIDVNGVAYDVAISLSTYSALGSVGGDACVYTHMASREDGVFLYGFSSIEEKKVFLFLITVSNIGPKLAIKILSGIGLNELKTAIASSDIAMLSTIPGVGKKTAERVVVELKDKMDAVAISLGSFSSLGGVVDDVIGALMNLGYKLQDCKKAIEGSVATESFDQVLKRALQNLSGKR